MDFLKQLIGEKSSELVAGLVEKTGFTVEQAEKFVPAATGSVVEAAQKVENLDPSNLGHATQSIMDKIDISALAQQVGIDKQLAQSGLTALLPNLLQSLQEKAGALGGLASMFGKGGDMLGGIGKMFGK